MRAVTRSGRPVAPVLADAARVRSALTAWLARPLTSLHIVLGVFGLLTLIGLVMVLSASSVESYVELGSSYSVFGRQLLFCLAGLVAFYLGLRVEPRRLRALAPTLLIAAIVLLVLVLVPGVGGGAIKGARSWFKLGFISVQPAELAKIALALWGAHVLAVRQRLTASWRQLLSPLLPVSLVIFTLIVVQPDLGTATSLAIVVGALLFFAGAPMRLFAGISVGGVAGLVVLALSASYRHSRVSSFLDPSADPGGATYQARQALYSLADGGLFGAGLGQGSAKWKYLPEAHNDFIFAIIGEELGMVGALAVLILFALLAYVGLRIAARNTDPWLKLVVATLTVWMVGQATINIGYVVGLLPVTGIPLPLVSSGGSALVTAMFVGGLLANAARHEPEAIAAMRLHGQGRVARLLGLRVPEPYRGVAHTPARGELGRTPSARPTSPRSGSSSATRTTSATRSGSSRSGYPWAGSSRSGSSRSVSGRGQSTRVPAPRTRRTDRTAERRAVPGRGLGPRRAPGSRSPW